MALSDFFSSSEMNNGLTAPARVRELVAVIKKEDSIPKSVSDITWQWSAVARTIAATVNKECLDLFIQLDGLHFINKWLKIAFDLSNATGYGFVEDITHLLQALENLHMDSQKSVSSEIWNMVKYLLSHGSCKLQNTAQALLDRWGKDRDGDTSSLDVDRVETLTDDGMGINARVKRNIWSSESLSGDNLPRKSSCEEKCLKSTVESSTTGFDEFQPDKLGNAHTSDINLDAAVMDDRPLDCICSPSLSKPENENLCNKVEPLVCGSIGTCSVESCTPAVPTQGALDRQTDFHKLQLTSDVKQTPNIGSSPEKLVALEKLELLEDRPYPSNSGAADALNCVTQPNLLKISNGAVRDSWQKGSASADVRTIDPEEKGDVYDDGRCTNQCRSPSASKTKEGGEFNMHKSYQIIDPLEVAGQIEMEREVKDFAEQSSIYSEKVSDDKIQEPDDSINRRKCNDEGSRKEVANDRDPSAGISPFAKEPAISTENQDAEQMNSEQDTQTSQVTEAVQEAASTEKSPFNFDLNEVFSDDTNCCGNAIPVSIVSASRAAAVPGFPVSPFQFEGNLGWKGSSATSAFRPASPHRIREGAQDLPSGGSSCSSKQQHGCLHIDLNLDGNGDGRPGDPLPDKQVKVSSCPPGKFSAEANSRFERIELDLNCSSEAGDVQSDWLTERQLFPEENDHHGQSHSSSSYLKWPVLTNIDLNGHPSFLNSSDNSHLSKLSQNLNASGGIKLDDSAISIMGTRVEVEHKDFVHQFLHRTPELSFDINLARTLEMGSALPYAHSTSYNGLAPAMTLSSMMYGPGAPIPYMMDSRGPPDVSQVVGCASSILPSLNPSFMISMTGSTASNGVVPPRTSMDLNSRSMMEGQNRDPAGFRQFLNMGQAGSTDEQPRSSSQLYISSVGGKRKEPDSGWEHYPFKHQTPPQI